MLQNLRSGQKSRRSPASEHQIRGGTHAPTTGRSHLCQQTGPNDDPSVTRIGLFLLLLGTLAACGNSDPRVALDGSDSGREVVVASGDEFQIDLESNPSTGYSWSLELGPAASILTLQSSSYSVVETDLVGAGGIETFVFEAIGPGAAILRLEYVRPFDEMPVPERVVEFIVRVDGAAWTPGTADPPTRSTASTDAMPVGVAELLTNDDPRSVTVLGFVLWDATNARLCEVLMESFPPQCGGPSVVITNPEALEEGALESARGVKWTDGIVELSGRFDGTELILGQDP